jgi:hypothetical protein
MVPSAINSKDEFDFVRQNFALDDPIPPPPADNKAAWLGLNRSGADWVEPDRCPTFTSFRQGEGADGISSSCAELVRDGMLDANCGLTTTSVICEQVRPSITGCDSPFDANRYRAVGGNVMHDAALAMCNLPDEHLVVIASDTEQAMVDDLAFANAIPKYWLGADFDTDTNRWSAPTGCPPWFGWATNEPTLLNGEALAVRTPNVGTNTVDIRFEMSGVICETN